MRRIPSALQEHLNGQALSVCRLLQLRLSDGRRFGSTSLDEDVEYNGFTYKASSGIDASVLSSDSALSVENAEFTSLFDDLKDSLKYEEVKAGALDNAEWILYLVNFLDVSMGHIVLDAGDVGDVKFKGNQAYDVELVSYAMRLREPIGTKDSLTCRAVFGSEPQGQYGCGVNAEQYWKKGTVDKISTEEPTRVFADTSILINYAMNVARIYFTKGDNKSGKMYQIEDYNHKTGTIALLEPTAFPIKAGDEFMIRRDCDKTHAQCKAFNNVLNFKGEPFIPVADGVEGMTPNAQDSGGEAIAHIVEVVAILEFDRIPFDNQWYGVNSNNQGNLIRRRKNRVWVQDEGYKTRIVNEWRTVKNIRYKGIPYNYKNGVWEKAYE